jgi:hypothetical protein
MEQMMAEQASPPERRVPSANRPRIPTEYGVATTPPDTTKYPWSRAVEQLAHARNYWLSTTRPDGRPHAMPIWALWLDDACYFSTNPSSRNGLNLAADPRVVLHLESGDDVVILEGTAERVADPTLLARYVEAYDAKYHWHINPASPDQAIYVLRPRLALTWLEREFAESAVRWRFDPE